MREIKQKIYKFEELNWKAKDKVREYFQDEYMESNSEIFHEDFIEELKSNGFEYLSPSYSLNYCQGDGCSVEGRIYLDEILDNEEIMKHFNETEKRRLNYINNELEYEISIKNYGNYYNPNSINFNAIVWVNNYTHRAGNLLEEVFEKLEEVLKDYFKSLCYKMEKIGYETIYGSDEGLDEFIIDFEREFYEDGTIYKY